MLVRRAGFIVAFDSLNSAQARAAALGRRYDSDAQDNRVHGLGFGCFVPAVLSKTAEAVFVRPNVRANALGRGGSRVERGVRPQP